MIEGVSIEIILVTVTNELYTSRKTVDRIRRQMNILVDILSFLSCNGSAVGGTDGNKLRV